MKTKTFFCRVLPAVLFLGAAAAGYGQTETIPQDPSPLIGITLSELTSRFGMPKQVYAVRGVAEWQDDVVFVYDNGEFYLFGNRVWMLKVRSVYNIKDGDTKASVTRTLGEGRDFEGYTLYQLPSRAWPMMFRINWTSSERVEGIYIYRSDF